MTQEHTADAYRIIQDGGIVARVEGPHALRDIIGHANQCAGPLSIQRRVNKRWKAYGLMEASGAAT